MEHSNSRTFQGLSRTYSVFKDFQGPGIFFPKFKDFQGLLKDPMNPERTTDSPAAAAADDDVDVLLDADDNLVELVDLLGTLDVTLRRLPSTSSSPPASPAHTSISNQSINVYSTDAQRFKCAKASR